MPTSSSWQNWLLQTSIQQAVRDPLTGLYNRRALEPLLKSLWQQAEEGTWLALLFADLDDFKSYNQTEGHLAGDKRLRQVAESLRQYVRQGDIIIRYGGDEFVVLSSNWRSPLDIEPAAERLQSGVQQQAVQAISVGWATIAAGEEYDLEKVLNAADQRMREAKSI